MLVTSLRDGMNLVAKEFVSSREDEDGVLVLSELTGAAGELQEALTVNPYSVGSRRHDGAGARDGSGGTAQPHGGAAPPDEQAHRAELGRPVHERHQRGDDRLPEPSGSRRGDDPGLHRTRSPCRSPCPSKGVLVPDARDASRSGPDPELMQLLRELTLRSGHLGAPGERLRSRTIDEWFDRVPAVLWAEHGLWRREAGGRRWRLTQWTASEWVDDVRQLMEQFVTSTPGAFVEARPTALTWQFGRADATFGQSQAQTLAALLQDAADFLGYEVTLSSGLVEVRAAGLSLHRTVQKVIEMNRRTRWCSSAVAARGSPRALRPGDILVDFSVEDAPDPRRARSLIRELADSLVPSRARPSRCRPGCGAPRTTSRPA